MQKLKKKFSALQKCSVKQCILWYNNQTQMTELTFYVNPEGQNQLSTSEKTTDLLRVYRKGIECQLFVFSQDAYLIWDSFNLFDMI